MCDLPKLWIWSCKSLCSSAEFMLIGEKYHFCSICTLMIENLKWAKHQIQIPSTNMNYIQMQKINAHLARCIPWNLQYCSALYQLAWNIEIVTFTIFWHCLLFSIIQHWLSLVQVCPKHQFCNIVLIVEQISSKVSVTFMYYKPEFYSKISSVACSSCNPSTSWPWAKQSNLLFGRRG